MRILIIGCKGMAGHIIGQYLKENTDWEIVSVDKEEFFVDETNYWKERLKQLNESKKIDYIINCIGILNRPANKNPVLALRINSLFPHQLAELSDSLGIKVIHLSTDCWADLDIYGRSKRAGEIDYDNHLTIRTSIIGPELRKEGIGLFHWFMMQESQASGFTKHFWDGVTTLQLAKKIKEIIEKPSLSHIVEYRTKEKVSKSRLLKDIKEVFNKEILLEDKETETVDKSNPNANLICEKSLREQISELKEWMANHRELYSVYKF